MLAEIAWLCSALVQHAPGQDGQCALLTVNTFTHLSFDVPPAQHVHDSCVKASEHVQEQAGPTAGSNAMDCVKDYELWQSAKH